MSAGYIICAAPRDAVDKFTGEHKPFRTQHGWSGEYPNARIFPNLQAAKRVRDTLQEATMIYSVDGYARGDGPVVQVQP